MGPGTATLLEEVERLKAENRRLVEALSVYRSVIASLRDHAADCVRAMDEDLTRHGVKR